MSDEWNSLLRPPVRDSKAKSRKAYEECYHAVQESPNSAQARYSLGFISLELNHLYEASDSLSKAVELDPKYIEAWFLLGFVLGRLGERQRAVEAYTRCLEINPEYSLARQRLSALDRQEPEEDGFDEF